MAQTFYTTENTDFHKGAHETDRPANDAALRSNFSGSSAPSIPTPVPGQNFYDTSHDILLNRNNAGTWRRFLMVAVFEVDTGSISTGYEIELTHGLGTNFISFSVVGYGSASAGNGQWSAVLTRPDGSHARFRGDDGNQASASAPAVPSTLPITGKFTVSVRNQRPTPQIIKLYIHVYAAGN